MRRETPLNELVAVIIQTMKNSQYSSGSIRNYEKIFLRLQKLADKRKPGILQPRTGPGIHRRQQLCILGGLLPFQVLPALSLHSVYRVLY